jgi:hypothetical protein
VIRKFFPLDKNYLLEEAQLALQDALLDQLVENVKAHHQAIHNPLGLDDSFTSRLKAYKSKNRKPLYSFYQNLAGVYRYKFGENQLGFVWDGRDHSQIYKEEWTQIFYYLDGTILCPRVIYTSCIRPYRFFARQPARPSGRKSHESFCTQTF